MSGNFAARIAALQAEDRELGEEMQREFRNRYDTTGIGDDRLTEVQGQAARHLGYGVADLADEGKRDDHMALTAAVLGAKRRPKAQESEEDEPHRTGGLGGNYGGHGTSRPTKAHGHEMPEGHEAGIDKLNKDWHNELLEMQSKMGVR